MRVVEGTDVVLCCRTAMKTMFLFLNLCLSLKLDCLWCSFVSTTFLTNVVSMVFTTTFNIFSAISLRSGLLLEETGVTGENHRSVGSHWQSFSHNVILSKPRLKGIRIHNVSAVVIGTDCICNYKSNYHAITTTTDPTNREYVRKIEN